MPPLLKDRRLSLVREWLEKGDHVTQTLRHTLPTFWREELYTEGPSVTKQQPALGIRLGCPELTELSFPTGCVKV